VLAASRAPAPAELSEDQWRGATDRFFSITTIVAFILLLALLAVGCVFILKRQRIKAQQRAFLYRVLGLFRRPSRELCELLERDDRQGTAEYLLRAMQRHSIHAVLQGEQFRSAFTDLYPALKAQLLRKRAD
jgi:hypothetical protein